MYPQLLFWSLLPLQLAIADTQLRVVHRVYLPLGGPVPFSTRGTVHITESSATFTSSKTIAQDLQQFANVLHELSADGALYQVGLEREGDTSQDDWDVSSVNACHLPSSTTDSLIFHVTNAGNPYSLDYFVAPIPHDGACPKETSNPLVFPVFENTTVHLRYPSLPPLPLLRTPPPLSPEGAPIQPVPEKSFVQKYWMYGVGLFLAVVLAAGPPEEEATSGGADRE